MIFSIVDINRIHIYTSKCWHANTLAYPSNHQRYTKTTARLANSKKIDCPTPNNQQQPRYTPQKNYTLDPDPQRSKRSRRTGTTRLEYQYVVIATIIHYRRVSRRTVLYTKQHTVYSYFKAIALHHFSFVLYITASVTNTTYNIASSSS